MKPFNAWLEDLTGEISRKKPAFDNDDLPLNVWYDDDRLYVDCWSCGDTCEIEDLSWIDGLGPDDEFKHWCGKNPSCLP